MPGALTLAATLPPGTGARLVASAEAAYVHGMHVAAVLGAALLVTAAVLLLLGSRRSSTRHHPDAWQTAELQTANDDAPRT